VVPAFGLARGSSFSHPARTTKKRLQALASGVIFYVGLSLNSFLIVTPPRIGVPIKRESRLGGGFIFFSAALGLSVQLFFCRGLSRYAA
jgi:hypothetical protein